MGRDASMRRNLWGQILDAALTTILLVASILVVYTLVGFAEIGLLPKEAFTMFMSVISPISSALLFISPFTAVKEAINKQSVVNLPTQVFKSQALCNILGIAYGIKIGNAPLAGTNLFGLAAQIVWLAADHYVREKDLQWFHFSVKMSMGLNAGLFFCVLMPIDILGTVITVFNIVLFASPLSKIGTVLRTRNASSMPLLMTIMMVACNGNWMMYAAMIQDSVVLLPSLLGYLLSVFQVTVIAWCNTLLPFDLSFLLLFTSEPAKSQTADFTEPKEAKELEESPSRTPDRRAYESQLTPPSIGSTPREMQSLSSL
jgi:hypothetical protein